jgi:hypothetical protein
MANTVKYKPFKWGDYSIVWVNSTDIHGALSFYERNRLDGIGISPHHGYRRKDLAFLSEMKDLRGFVISDGDINRSRKYLTFPSGYAILRL